MTDFSNAQRLYHSLPDNLKTPYHNPDYVALDASEKRNAIPIFFNFKKDGDVFYHPLHLIHTPELHVNDLESVRGYGGPITTSNNAEFLREAFKTYKAFCLEHNICVEFVRFCPALGNHCNYYGDVYFDRDTCAINLADYTLEKNSHGAISNINKSLKKNCEVFSSATPSSAQIKAFNYIYNQRMSEMNADAQYIYGNKYFEQIFDGVNELCWVEYNGEMISAAIFLQSPEIIEYHLSAATPEGRKIGTTSLVLHHYAMQNRNKSTILHLGGGTNKNPDNTLLLFKQAMGKLTKKFYVGKFIHNHEQYNELQTIFKNNNGRVIFYRS